MVRSRAKTVSEYLDELPPERREVLEAVRGEILENLPAGYVETMNWGMISYEVPLSRYPDTYNGQPLSYVGLAAQKHHYAVYLMNAYSDSEQEARLRAAFESAGKKLDMGKCCLRFKRLDQIPRGAIGTIVASSPVDDFIDQHERARAR